MQGDLETGDPWVRVGVGFIAFCIA
jgi:hypothetical protein